MADPRFDMAAVVKAVVGQAERVVADQTSKVGLAIFLLIFIFHVIEGAAELAESPGSCRLLRGRFWLRIFLTGALLGGYGQAVGGTMMQIQPRFMLAFATEWNDIWNEEAAALKAIRKAEEENKALKLTEVATSKAGRDDDTWYAKLGRYVTDALLTGVGWLLAWVIGLLITLVILMEGFWVLGVTMLIVAIGPICVACLAHEKTEGIFWSFLKAFVVYGLLYLPMLGIACRFAGVVMSRVGTMAATSGMVYGDGSDIAVHLLMVVLGPLSALAVVRAVPHLVTTLIGAAALGAGAGAVADAGSAVGRSASGAIAVGGAAVTAASLPLTAAVTTARAAFSSKDSGGAQTSDALGADTQGSGADAARDDARDVRGE
jgi:hypothetical protein